jgi:hypothetical protein
MLATNSQILVEAYLRGAAWRPGLEFQNLLNLNQASVAKMDGNEADAKLLIRSYQMADINYETLVRAYHARFPDYSGSIGPATKRLANLARCPIPDFAPPPGASFDYGDAELNAAVESYQRYAEAGYIGGSGSWPRGCDKDPSVDPNWHSVVVRIDVTNASTHQKGIMSEVLKMVEQTEAEIGQHVRHVPTHSNPQHDVKFQFIAGGVIGFAYFPDPNNCNQTVTARIDNSFDARPTVLAELLTHEYKGHSDGLEHTRGGIMNPSIGSPTTRSSWIGDNHESTKRRYFGGVAIPSGPTTTTTQAPGPGPGPTPTGSLKLPIIVQDANGKRYGLSPMLEV